jgi:KUP system potassium uptake protein
VSPDTHSPPQSRRYQFGLVVGALGVVYGDIGTSPLYALRECFSSAYGIAPTRENLLGLVSLILWSVFLIVSIKYLTFILRADNNGEGGILALLSLVVRDRESRGERGAALLVMGVFGAALLYGDGVITPAISVLSAVEGLNVATHFFEPYILPLTVVVLLGLFYFQRSGTASVGSVFGPVMVLWFATLGVLGVRGILQDPQVLLALNPWHGVRFLLQHGMGGFMVMGAVVLAVTGAEALYADLGHFGARSIRRAWWCIVLPGLVLNYLGQGALILADPTTTVNPFYQLAPKWGVYPLVVLSTAATVIASQALISGTFSLTMQAIQLGYFPRLAVQHTSSAERGQVYVPRVNHALAVVCVALVLGFGSSTRLAAAYGVAVTMTMVITSVLFYFAARRIWGWSVLKAGGLCACFLTLELTFCLANLLKVAHGGWVPLVIGAVVYVMMSTWQKGRGILRERLQAASLPLDMFLAEMAQSPTLRVPGTAVFLAGNLQGTPLALLHNLKHNKVLHERVILLTVRVHDMAHVPAAGRVDVEPLSCGFCRVTGHYGFMDEPDVLLLLRACEARGVAFRPQETTFFLSSETVIPKRRGAMFHWREELFAVMARNAQRATAFFRLPANRVVELGMQIEL